MDSVWLPSLLLVVHLDSVCLPPEAIHEAKQKANEQPEVKETKCERKRRTQIKPNRNPHSLPEADEEAKLFFDQKQSRKTNRSPLGMGES